jgi:hypothetical protein
MADEYIFSNNGSYQFYSKLFSMTMDKIILIKELGNYKIENKSLTISPVRSVIESYAKKDGLDKWGKLLTTEKRPLEKVANTFSIGKNGD